MARYKEYSYEQGKLIPVHFKDQILPGSFEYALNHIIDHELDLSLFESRYQNDEEGAPAYDPAILLKIVLYAYSRGITSSRKIEQCCRNNIVFMALSADTQPHFTTISNFISSMDKEILSLFRNVLLIYDATGLIGKQSHILEKVAVTADSGFHSEANMKMLAEEKIDGYIADNRFRKRDPRFATADRHNKPIRKERPTRKYFAPSDFKYDEGRGKYLCPAG
ncbi:MAG: transposase, partial [Bacteroidota bacterium]